jgi:serine/threonine protein kinase
MSAGGDQRAVKMLREGAGADDRRDFLREAETMLDLGLHPNLVQILGVCISQRPWLVVLEFCTYGDLSDVLKACPRKGLVLNLQVCCFQIVFCFCF